MRRAPVRIPLGSAAAVALLAFAGCGDEPTSSSTTIGGARAELASIRPCELLTPAEIEAATGRAPGAPRDMSAQAAGVPMCNWPPAGGREYDVLAGLLVTVNAYDSYDEFLESAQDSPLGELTPDELQQVDAGDFGVWMNELEMLQVYAGNRMVQISASPADGRDPIQAARELALAALAKLD